MLKAIDRLSIESHPCGGTLEVDVIVGKLSFINKT
jgi:hypothetical protein